MVQHLCYCHQASLSLSTSSSSLLLRPTNVLTFHHHLQYRNNLIWYGKIWNLCIIDKWEAPFNSMIGNKHYQLHSCQDSGCSSSWSLYLVCSILWCFQTCYKDKDHSLWLIVSYNGLSSFDLHLEVSNKTDFINKDSISQYSLSVNHTRWKGTTYKMALFLLSL